MNFADWNLGWEARDEEILYFREEILKMENTIAQLKKELLETQALLKGYVAMEQRGEISAAKEYPEIKNEWPYPSYDNYY